MQVCALGVNAPATTIRNHASGWMVQANVPNADTIQ
jgi:hypothetical protein